MTTPIEGEDEPHTLLSSLVGAQIAKIQTPTMDAYLHFYDKDGKVLFMLSPDDLFDADGNRFEDDLP
jgi:hypothetical protein